jgi:hypothetical protein
MCWSDVLLKLSMEYFNLKSNKYYIRNGIMRNYLLRFVVIKFILKYSAPNPHTALILLSCFRFNDRSFKTVRKKLKQTDSLKVILPSMSRSSKWSFQLGFPTKILYAFSHVPSPSHPP